MHKLKIVCFSTSKYRYNKKEKYKMPKRKGFTALSFEHNKQQKRKFE
jgi:hypothetical protein